MTIKCRNKTPIPALINQIVHEHKIADPKAITAGRSLLIFLPHILLSLMCSVPGAEVIAAVGTRNKHHFERAFACAYVYMHFVVASGSSSEQSHGARTIATTVATQRFVLPLPQPFSGKE